MGMRDKIEQVAVKATLFPELEYIEKGAFIEDIKTEIINLRMNGLKGTPRPHDELYDFIDRINEQPAADVAPVVHGRVVTISDRWHVFHQNCSECGADLPWKEYPNYCYNCGAKLDLEEII